MNVFDVLYILDTKDIWNHLDNNLESNMSQYGFDLNSYEDYASMIITEMYIDSFKTLLPCIKYNSHLRYFEQTLYSFYYDIYSKFFDHIALTAHKSGVLENRNIVRLDFLPTRSGLIVRAVVRR